MADNKCCKLSDTVSRRRFIEASAITGSLGLAGCLGGGNGSGGNGSGSVQMTIATLFPESHAISQGAMKFKNDIEEETNGSFSVDVSVGGTYGDQTEITGLLQNGSLEATGLGLGPFQQYASQYFFIQTPFAVRDMEHIRAIADSDVFQPAYEALKEQGNQRLIGDMFYRGVRQTYTTSNAGEVRTVEDIQGVPMRITPWRTWQQTWNEVGVDPRSISLNEVYTAVENGVVEAFEGPFEQTRSTSQYEVIENVNLTKNLTSVGGFYVSESFFKNLDTTYQDLVRNLFNDASKRVSEITRENEQKNLNFFRDQGLTIIEDTNPTSFNRAARPALENFYKNQWASDYDTIMSIGK